MINFMMILNSVNFRISTQVGLWTRVEVWYRVWIEHGVKVVEIRV